MPDRFENIIVLVKENQPANVVYGRYVGPHGEHDPHAERVTKATNPPHFTLNSQKWTRGNFPTHGHTTYKLYGETHGGIVGKLRWWLSRVLGTHQQFDRDQLGFHYGVLDEGVGTLMTNTFQSTTGPSTGGHLHLWAASSGGYTQPDPNHSGKYVTNEMINNPRNALLRWITRDRGVQPPFDIRSIPELMDRAGYNWANYGDLAGPHITYINNKPEGHKTSKDFFTDLASGSLPNFSYLMSPNGAEEGPPSAPDAGQLFTQRVIQALIDADKWEGPHATAVVEIYDDWGGMYDPVTSPTHEYWPDGSKAGPGSRLGTVFVSAYSSGIICDQFNTEDSLARFVENNFGLTDSRQYGLPFLSWRDQASNGFSAAYDLTKAPTRPSSSLMSWKPAIDPSAQHDIADSTWVRMNKKADRRGHGVTSAPGTPHHLT